MAWNADEDVEWRTSSHWAAPSLGLRCDWLNKAEYKKP